MEFIINIIITGGAGFVGSRLAEQFKKKNPSCKITVIDNLKRRGSELNLLKFKKLGIEFIHGDIRDPKDLMSLEKSFDIFIEASAEPSVHAGIKGDPSYLINTNLIGTINCLEFARKFCKKMIFLSTSRVYSIPAMLDIPLIEKKTRFTVDPEAKLLHGLSQKGISEDFSTLKFRSLYGSTKLSSELIIQEYCHHFNMDIIINRCGVIAGAGQFGKVDQGVFTLWVANHYFNRPLKYTGFGGGGKQVRDLLHPDDLFQLINLQLNYQEKSLAGEIFNIGGGQEISTSLLEFTHLCKEITNKEIGITSHPETNPVDIPYYISDFSKAEETLNWKPEIKTKHIVQDIYDWLKKNESELRPLFCS